MAAKKKTSHEPPKILHPGSSAKDAAKIGGKGDFGVPESNVTERTYTSLNTKASDRGAAQPRSGEGGLRTSGVGGINSGPGSASGGDLDPTSTGLSGSGLSASGRVNEPAGPDDTDGSSAAFASGPPAQGRNQKGPVQPIRGSTVQAGNDRTTGPQGADGVANSDPDNDASAGEISSGEASGEDN